MALSPDLLEMLVCPICKEHVQPLPEDSGLKCPVCRRVYPVRDDIPVMANSEASFSAGASSAREWTLVIPTDEPRVAGFTNTG